MIDIDNGISYFPKSSFRSYNSANLLIVTLTTHFVVAHLPCRKPEGSIQDSYSNYLWAWLVLWYNCPSALCIIMIIRLSYRIKTKELYYYYCCSQSSTSEDLYFDLALIFLRFRFSL